MELDADFDGGSIVLVEQDGPASFVLELRPDNAADLRQWFAFRVRGAAGQKLRFRIVNASLARYRQGFEDFRAWASADGERWAAVPTHYDGEALTLVHTALADEVRFAEFPLYDGARRERLLERVRWSPHLGAIALGPSLFGRSVDAIVGGAPRGPALWLIARQHPGETVAEWVVEGLVDRLLTLGDGAADRLLSRARLAIVPCMNPDGATLGNHRTNGAGVDLNRAWLEPDPERAREVDIVREHLREEGVDLFVDIHGEEAIPYAFVAGCEGNPSYSRLQAEAEAELRARLVVASPEFRAEGGYPLDAPGTADLSQAANWVAEQLGCASITLELPMKHRIEGGPLRWGPVRARAFGASLVSVLADFAQRWD
jgi:murein tripeptide amidase MpaA